MLNGLETVPFQKVTVGGMFAELVTVFFRQDLRPLFLNLDKKKEISIEQRVERIRAL